MKRRTVTKRNPIARALQSPLFRKRVVKSKRGKGAYDRKEQPKEDSDG